MLERGIPFALADECLVISQCRLEQLLAQRLEAGDAQEPALGNAARQVAVDRVGARLTEVVLGLGTQPLGAKPQPSRRGKPTHKDHQQRRDQPRHRRVAAAPSPGPLRPP